MLKKLLSLFLSFVFCLTFCVPAFATNPDSKPSITEEEFLEAIENGTATITSEVRDASTYTATEINSDPGLAELFSNISNGKTRTINETTKLGSMYTTTVTLDTGDIVIYRLMPYCTLLVSDVGTASSSDITSTLIIAESITVNGVLTDWDNYIHLKNISISMGCGHNTSFTEYITIGGTGRTGIVDTSTILALLGTAVSLTEFAIPAAILSAFSSISFPSDEYVSSTAITSANVRAIGAQWKSNLRLQNTEHTLWAQSSLSTVDSSLEANVTTYAVAKWKFDIYYGLGTLSPAYSNVSLIPETQYLVNVK